MPVKSQAQRRAMYAAKEGHSTLGIPKKVGEDFVEASHGIKNLPERVGGKEKSSFSKAMQSHGVAKGDGTHKRHPATSHYGMGPQGNRFGKR